MTRRVAVAIVSFCACTSMAILGMFVMSMMVGEVNRKVPDSEQIKYLFWYPGKYGKLKREYRRLYPQGRLVLALDFCIGLQILFFVVFVSAFGFFG